MFEYSFKSSFGNIVPEMSQCVKLWLLLFKPCHYENSRTLQRALINWINNVSSDSLIKLMPTYISKELQMSVNECHKISGMRLGVRRGVPQTVTENLTLCWFDVILVCQPDLRKMSSTLLKGVTIITKSLVNQLTFIYFSL